LKLGIGRRTHFYPIPNKATFPTLSPGNNPLQRSSINKLLQDKEQASTHMEDKLNVSCLFGIRNDQQQLLLLDGQLISIKMCR